MFSNFILQTAILNLLILGTQTVEGSKSGSSWPSSLHEFSGSFQQPEPPKIHSEFRTSFIQHKWLASNTSRVPIKNWPQSRNVNLSHVTQGYIFNSPSKQQVRVDEAFEGTLASSIFNYANISQEGQVENILTSTTSSSLKNPEQFRGYVTPNFPLWAEGSLQDAVFTGLVKRDFVSGKAASVSAVFSELARVFADWASVGYTVSRCPSCHGVCGC